MTPTNELLREYARDGSETAFRQLVERYIDLVFSTALRRLCGDRHRAEDAAQIVFTDFARKAQSLPENVMLGGWLHRHSCFVASNLTRAEMRRAAREKEAVVMENLHAQNDASWSEVAPELDQAIDSLPPEDRDAIVLRFFERQDFKAIGAAIGGSENAAQKRVARAVEKLRQLLDQRGVALSTAALMAGLTTEAISAAPAALAENASTTALGNAAAKSGVFAALTSSVAIAIWALIAGLVVGIAVVTLNRPKQSGTSETNASAAAAGDTALPGSDSLAASPRTEELAQNSNVEITRGTGSTLRLTVVAADTGNPVPNVPIEYRATEGNRWLDKSLVASRAGILLVPFTENTTELRLITRTEAFADTRLFWQTRDGEPLPSEYTVRLKRGARIGGKVVNSRGDLVPGAVIGFSMPIPDADLSRKTEGHEIEYIQIVAEDGTWQSLRVPEALLRRTTISASHPDYAGSEPPMHPTPAAVIDSLLKGEHVFRLRDGMTVRGIVVDKHDRPVAGAKVLIGRLHESGSKEALAGGDGRFEISGCTPGKTLATAWATNFAAATVRVDSPPREDGYRIVLEPGRVLKLRLVSTTGEPIPKAHAWLKWIDADDHDGTKAPLVQAEFDRRTDAEGRIEWDLAPAPELTFDFWAAGFMRRTEVKVAADGIEHTFTLLPALKISGAVRDAISGAPIPKFRVIAGWPGSFIPPGGKLNVHWSEFERDWAHGSNGRFEQTYDSPIVFGVDTNRYIFKVEADGYNPFVTRIVNENEGSVQFDVQLQRGGSSTLTFITPDGRPAPDTDVVFAQNHAFIRLGARGVLRNTGQRVLLTDNKGQIALPTDDPKRVIAAGPGGFVMLDLSDNPLDGLVRLQPWGRVEGRATRRGKPLEGWKLHIGSDAPGGGFQMEAGATTTDSDGRFTIESAPAGKFKLVRLSRGANANAYAHLPIRDIEIQPGRTTHADYEEKGIAASVRVVFPPGFKRGPQHNLFCSASLPYPQPPREELADPAAMARWRERPEVKAAMAKMSSAQFSENDGGVWRTENLEPGEWTLTARVFEQAANPTPGTRMTPLLVGAIQVRVPENPASDQLDLGEIVLTTETATATAAAR